MVVNGGRRYERVEADAARCVASGQCAVTAPLVFDQDGDGQVVVLTAEPVGAAAQQAREAAARCPVPALRLRPAG
ncbi:ferredoxin [Kitasatospora sp. NPDC094011]|uniref:ferredoxin n=1 Tax=Kitasatospora sp. NPDC094011 TaxID=3364090 RepID=UPI003806CC43